MNRGRPPWVGVMLPVQDFGDGFASALEMARTAERLGFDSVWVGDHLSFRQPIVESIVMASAVAAITERMSVGFGVLQIAMRQPVWLAKQLGTLCHLSGERIEIGVGIGGENPTEWKAAGVPVRERVGRTVELMRLLPDLLAGKPLRHRGRYYEIDAPALLPAPARPPKLWMGGRAEGALRRAAQLADGWLGLWVDAERVRGSAERMAEYSRVAGRESPEIALVVPVLVEQDPARAAAAFGRFTKLQYGADYERFARWCVAGLAGQVAERLGELRDAGSSGFVLMPVAEDPVAQLEPLAQAADLLRVR